MTLLEGDGRTYSMDMSCWHRVLKHELAPVKRQPYTPGQLDQLSDFRRSQTQGSDAYDPTQEASTVDLIERVSLPALRVSDLWSGTSDPVRVVFFDLGTCSGRQSVLAGMHRAAEYQSGSPLSRPHRARSYRQHGSD
jgi:hypothetical protein